MPWEGAPSCVLPAALYVIVRLVRSENAMAGSFQLELF